MAVADDKLAPPATKSFRKDGIIEVGRRSTGSIKNLIALVEYPFNDSICGKKETVECYGRTSPVGDADYATLPIGSKFTILTIVATAVTDAKEWIKTANGWESNMTSLAAQQNTKVTVTAMTDADNSLTAAKLLGGILTQTPGAHRTNTFESAANIVAAIPNCVVGSSIKFSIKNLAAATYNSIIGLPSGITNGGVTADLTLAAGASGTYVLVASNVTSSTEALVLYKI